MGTKIRYVNLDEVSPELFVGLWEYDFIIQPKELTLFRFCSDRILVEFWEGSWFDKKDKKWKDRNTNLSDYFLSTELSDIELVRPYSRLDYGEEYGDPISYYVQSPNITNFMMFHQEDPASKVGKAFEDSIREVLQDIGIETKNKSNDIFLKSGGTFKKFCGTLRRPSVSGYTYKDVSLTYKLELDVVSQIRNISSQVKVKKFDVEDISEMICGIWEDYPEIDKNKFESEIINRVCDILNFEIKDDSLTISEKKMLFERGNRRLTEDEWYLYGNNEKFDIYKY